MAGLHMINVKRLLAVHEGRSGSHVLEWPHASPVLVSGRIEPRAVLRPASPSDESLDWAVSRFSERDPMEMLRELYPVVQLIADTDVHVGQNSCTRIFVAGLEESKDLGTNPQADIQSHRVWDQRVEIDLAVTERGFVRLAYAYFPSLCVRVNGVEVEPMTSAGGFLVLPLSAGESRIEIEARLSNLRRVLLGLDILVVLSVVWLWRRERNPPAICRQS